MYPQNSTKTNVLEERVYRARIEGTGASAPTKDLGNGVTVARQAEGVYRFSFTDNPGTLIGFHHGLGGATTKGHTVTRSELTAPSGDTPAYVDLSVWDASAAADDLEADEFLDATFVFSASSLVS